MEIACPISRSGGTAEGRYALGIDLGGTKIAGAVVNLETGVLFGRRQRPTEPERGGEAVLQDVLTMAQELRAVASSVSLEPVGVGLGVPELVDPSGGVFSSYRIAWSGVPVQERLSAVLPALVEADVRAAAQAEAQFGAGRGFEHFLYVTVGTGVSAVSVQHGRPYAGARGAALVIANGTMRHRCPACGHEDAQVLEEVAGGAGIAQAVGMNGADQVLAAAEAGDAKAIFLINSAARELGQTLALLAGALDPEAIIVGGGLGSAEGLYFKALCHAVLEGLWDGDSRVLPIRQAGLGPDAGIIGAALCAGLATAAGDKGNVTI